MASELPFKLEHSIFASDFFKKRLKFFSAGLEESLKIDFELLQNDPLNPEGKKNNFFYYSWKKSRVVCTWLIIS